MVSLVGCLDISVLKVLVLTSGKLCGDILVNIVKYVFCNMYLYCTFLL